MSLEALSRSSGLAAASPREADLDEAALKRMEDFYSRLVGAGLIPGAAALIARGGKLAFVGLFGALKPDGPPMPLDAIFRIYSMTKPIVSVAAMRLVEEGRLILTDPLAKFAPAFETARVGVERDGELTLAPLKRPIMIHDLFRHTSGITYGFTGGSEVQKRYLEANLMSQEKTAAEHVETIARLPLRSQPGEVWDYSNSTDVLGRVLEILEGQRLGEILGRRVFDPLGMSDTAFFTPPDKLARRAEAFSLAMLENLRIDPIAAQAPPRCEFGGGGLVSTLSDYVRFCAMLAGGGGARILSPRTIAYMAANHLGAEVKVDHPLLAPGNGFGLGFGVRVAPGLAPTIGSVGEYYWGGMAGTAFFITPAEDLFAILLAQAPEHRDFLRQTFRNLVYSALDRGRLPSLRAKRGEG